MKRSATHTDVNWIWVFLLVFLGASTLMAQAPTATILGVVKDSSGAAVPDADLTARNVETGQTRTANSSGDGSYRFSALQVGKYEVRAEKTGFQTGVRAGLTLTVGQEAVVDFALTVGSMSQEVTVTSEAPLVNTTSGSLGSLVDEQSVAELPLNGRNYVDLTLLQPGITQHRSLGANPSNAGIWYSSNGAPVHSNYFILDGAPLSNLQGVNSASASGYTLGVDGVREYKIITNAFSAEYGMTMGSQEIMVSRGGTNKWSGDAFEYIRNNVIDARNYFDQLDVNNVNGKGANNSLPYPGKRLPPYQRNDFGVSFGGPIQKDKTFFYAVYEGVRQRQGPAIIDTVLPAGCHLQTVGQTVNGTGPAILPGMAIWNGVGTPPSGETTSVGNCPQIGGATSSTVTLSAVTAPLLALFPIANITTASGLNSQFTYPFNAPTRDDYGQIRVDHTFSASDSMFVRFTIDNGSLLSSVIQNAGPFSYPGFTMNITSQSEYTSISENHVFSPFLLNSARFSVSRTPIRFASGSPYTYPTPAPCASGLSVGYFVCGASTNDVGNINVTGLSGMGPFPTAPAYLPQTIFSYGDDVFYTRGKHSFKFGTLINRYQQQNHTLRGYRGTATFNSVANFLQDQTTSSMTYLAPTSALTRNYRSTTIGFYAQDDFRVTSRFTLNLGVRYEFMTQLNEKNGLQNDIPNPQTAVLPTTVPPTCADSGWNCGGVPFKNPTFHNVSPRIGFAWDVLGNGKTSVRGGYGLLYDLSPYGTAMDVIQTNQKPFTETFTIAGAPGATIPVCIPFNATNCPNGAATVSKDIAEFDYNIKQQHLLSYNLTVEQQLPFAMGLSVAYAGSRGLNLMSRRDVNPRIPNGVPTAVGSTQTCTATLAATPNLTSMVDGSATACWAANVGSANPNAFVNPAWPGSIILQTGAASSFYNSLQVLLTKRVTKGLNFQSAYTWSKLLDNPQSEAPNEVSSAPVYPMDSFHNGPDYALSSYDAKHNWRFNATYRVPGMSATSGVLPKVVNGWQISAIESLQSGYPFTVNVPTNVSRSVQFSSANGIDRPDLVAGRTAYSITHGTSAGCGTVGTNGYVKPGTPLGTVQMYYDTCAFTAAPAGLLGNSPRNYLRGPGLANLDFSLVKNTAIKTLGENGNVEFRAEFFNFMNHPNFSIPTDRNFPDTPLLTSTGSATSRQLQLALKVMF